MDSDQQAAQRLELQNVCGIPVNYLDEWQGFLNSLAKTLDLPSCLIMLYHNNSFAILAENLGNEADGEQPVTSLAKLYDGVYCKQVLVDKEPLFIRDARKEKGWKKTAAKTDYINYLGFPLLWPDKDPFGTICVVDTKPRKYKEEEKKLLFHFSRIIEAHLELIFEKNSLEDSNEDLEILVRTDSLTRITNRRGFQDQAKSEMERARRYGNKICLLMIDIDRFKNFNDRYGHDIGDRVLHQFARETKKMIRDSDVFARIGGEEFSILMPETNADDAFQFAERLRKHIANLELKINDHTCRFTISIGLLEITKKTTTLKTALKEADKLLYKAKKGGRNKTCR